MKYLHTFLILVAVVILNHETSAEEFSFYTVFLNNFSGKIYSQDISRFRISSGDSEFSLPDTCTQKTLNTSLKNGVYTLVLETGKINNSTVSGQNNISAHLSDSRLLNLDDPEIQKIKSGLKNSKSIINDVENFVYDYISDKSAGLPLMNASDILKNKSGDCTEHTVLAVSILRSMGIPARALVGMMLAEEFEGKKNIFVYHMWAEAFVNGKWILVDAANPGLKHGNRYIAFAYHHLLTEMPLSYLKAVSAMKSFSVEYME